MEDKLKNKLMSLFSFEDEDNSPQKTWDYLQNKDFPISVVKQQAIWSEGDEKEKSIYSLHLETNKKEIMDKIEKSIINTDFGDEEMNKKFKKAMK